MTPAQLRRYFPNISADTLAANAPQPAASRPRRADAGDRGAVGAGNVEKRLEGVLAPSFQVLTLDGFRPKSINELLRAHWLRVSAESKRTIAATHDALLLARADGVTYDVFDSPINVRVDTYFTGNAQDSANNLSSKWILDTLIEVWFPDDTPAHIHDVTHRAHPGAERDRVVVTGAVVTPPF